MSENPKYTVHRTYGTYKTYRFHQGLRRACQVTANALLQKEERLNR